MGISKTTQGASWLARFPAHEANVVEEIIDEILLVGRDDLSLGLHGIVDDILHEQTEKGENLKRHPLALYAEREVIKEQGRILPFFPNSEQGRALGDGVPPIVTDPRSQEVGSEGIIANLITDFCRSQPTAVNHPGPDKLRSQRVRAIVIVTDFIGSGNRIFEMLEAFRYVATLRSWKSYGLIRYIVAAYSGTISGIEVVQKSELRPNVKVVSYCPTISNTFWGKKRRSVEALCRRYPEGHETSLGFRDAGALIAFGHGCPNNMPPILHSNKNGWVPLFPGRSTSSTQEFFAPDTQSSLDQRLQKLLKIRDARKTLAWAGGERWISCLLVLAAAEAGARSLEDMSARAHLTVEAIADLTRLAINALWLDERLRLTYLGRLELEQLRRRRRRLPALPLNKDEVYYPTQLRAP
jgi:hypothetical protein